MTYPVVELFSSIQGEGFHAGCPAIFVRFWGCNNKCVFCDTQYAWALPRTKTAREFTPEELADKILSPGIPRVVLTGGEPLLHDLAPLLEVLPREFSVELETSGAIPVPRYLQFPYQPREWSVWATVSPKPAADWKAHWSWIERANTWKFLVDEAFTPERVLEQIPVERLKELAGRIYLVPLAPPSMEVVNAPIASREALTRTIQHVMSRPSLFRLSLQLHKLINVR